MHRMNYEKRLMNAPASNHFPDKYAHTYSFSPQPASPLPNPHPPSATKSAFFFPADSHRNSTLLSRRSAKSLTFKYNYMKRKPVFVLKETHCTLGGDINVFDRCPSWFGGQSPPCRLLVIDGAP